MGRYCERFSIILACLTVIFLFCRHVYAETFPMLKPVLTPAADFTLNDYCLQRKIGSRDFYTAAQGAYLWYTQGGRDGLRQAGFEGLFIPGHANLPNRLDSFAPLVKAALSPLMQDLVEMYLENRYPIHSIEYMVMQGNPGPSPEALKVIDNLWIGDGQPEELIYRLEPVFHYFNTGEKWKGSSSHLWKDEAAIDFFKNRFEPRVKEELPFYKDTGHQWSRKELRRLCDIYIEEWAKPIKRLIAWGMFLSPYYIASMEENITVGEKGADAYANAQARGIMRQSGGNKFFLVWRGHEPTERYGYYSNAWYTTRGDDWGYPLPHIWYYIFRPFLIGASYYVNEGFPGSLYHDMEGDGNLKLTATGYIFRDMLDFVGRHPERGVPYAPVALLQDYNRVSPLGLFMGYKLPERDDADHMNYGILNNLLFPEHRHTRYTGGYSRTAPYGEIFDLLSPNLHGIGENVDEKALENYRVLFAMGGLEIDDAFAKKLEGYVHSGGSLVVNAADAGGFSADFMGAEIYPEIFESCESVCALCGKKFEEQKFSVVAIKPHQNAEVLVYGSNNRPLVIKSAYGRGSVILVAARYMVQDETVDTREGRIGRLWQKKPLLNFVPHFFDHLCAGITPVEILRREEDREDLSWIINRKGKGWQVVMFNYSLEKEMSVKPGGTAKVTAEYLYKKLPFQIVANVPIADVMELYGDRDVKWETANSSAVISEGIRGGEILVYELQPEPIQIKPRSRYVNHALKMPAEVSSSMDKYPAGNAVDGDAGNYWWSGTDGQGRTFPMPQWLRVDLGGVKTIDHIRTVFHSWKTETLDTRLQVYKYIVEASADGENWVKVIDESKNEAPARAEGVERWFDPVEARYVRVTVMRNSALGGVRLVEFEVKGKEKEEYLPDRKPCISS
ncbi:MAG: discoidin domain-containing protein [Candidatus Omnitrophica bacterium]|nr:discoidin domain-containing protein [Candidatus Omnitrophota bacterium]